MRLLHLYRIDGFQRRILKLYTQKLEARAIRIYLDSCQDIDRHRLKMEELYLKKKKQNFYR